MIEFFTAYQHFLDYLSSFLKYSTHTVKNYEYDLERLNKFLIKKAIAFQQLNKKQCRYYLEERANHSGKTVSREISAFRHCWEFLNKEYHLNDNPWMKIRLPKQEKTLPTIISTKEMLAFLDGISMDTVVGIRNRMICESLYGFGVRVSELCSLTLNDINLESGECLVVGKGNKERIALIGDVTKEIIKVYLSKARSTWAISECNALIINGKGKPMTTRSIQRIVKQCSVDQGLKKHLTPHVFRHCYASDLYKGGADISVIKELLGHDHLSTTEIYTHVANEELKETILLSHPRSK